MLKHPLAIIACRLNVSAEIRFDPTKKGTAQSAPPRQMTEPRFREPELDQG
jgi:hypothetical protein